MNSADLKTIVDEKMAVDDGTAVNRKTTVDDETAIDKESIAIKKLLRHEPVKDKLGMTGEYEVCTTVMANRRTWRSFCQVRYNGLEKEEFPPICIDRTQQMRRHKAENTEELQKEFAREAINAHFTRCAEVNDYVTAQTQHSRIRPNLKIGAVLIFLLLLLSLAGYWFLFADTKSPHSGAKSIDSQNIDEEYLRKLLQGGR